MADHVARSGLQLSGKQLQQRRLPASVGTDHGHPIAPGKRQGHLPEDPIGVAPPSPSPGAPAPFPWPENGCGFFPPFSSDRDFARRRWNEPSHTIPGSGGSLPPTFPSVAAAFCREPPAPFAPAPVPAGSRNIPPYMSGFPAV